MEVNDIMNIIRKRAIKGFTLAELMVTLAVIAILLAVGIPSFQNYIANQRATAAAQDLLIILLQARSEAVKRNSRVDISFSRDSSSKKWWGWAVIDKSDTANSSKAFSDCCGTISTSQTDCTVNPTPTYCLNVQVVQGNITLDGGNTNITYRASGRLPATSTITPFLVCVQGAKQRQVGINVSGLPEILSTETICP